MKIVEVQFSGNGKGLYPYVTFGDDVTPGCRVVVPTKMKEDGTVSLSIATVINVYEAAGDLDRLKHVIVVIPHLAIELATRETRKIDSLPTL